MSVKEFGNFGFSPNEYAQCNGQITENFKREDYSLL